MRDKDDSLSNPRKQHWRKMYVHTCEAHTYIRVYTRVSMHVKTQAEPTIQARNSWRTVTVSMCVCMYVCMYVCIVIWDGALWFWSVIKTIMTDCRWLSFGRVVQWINGFDTDCMYIYIYISTKLPAIQALNSCFDAQSQEVCVVYKHKLTYYSST